VRAPARSAAVVASWLLALGLCAGFVFVAVSAGTNLGDASSALVGITFSTVGVVIASKRPENRVGLIFLGIGLSLSLNAFAFTGADYVRATSGSPLWHWLAWVGTWSWQPGFFLLTPVLLMSFPDGRVRWEKGRLLLRICLAGACASMIGTIWNPSNLAEVEGYTNPVGLEGLLDPLDYLLAIGTFLWLPLGVVASSRGLFLRFKGSTQTERQQLKWFVFTGFATLVTYVGGSAVYNSFGHEWGGFVALLGVPLLPIATAIAILRYRLYEIDRVVNRTLVYGSLTGILAVVYLGSVVLLRGLLGPITRDSDIAVAGSTLAVAACARPLLRRVQRFIDRRFYRSRYDAAQTLGLFSARLRDQLDLDSLKRELVAVVGSTMQPTQVWVWMKPPGGAR
jgi:hypothetical protein